MIADNIISLLIFLPAVAAVIVLLLPPRLKETYKWITLSVSLVQVVMAIVLFLKYSAHAGLQMIERTNWITVNLGSWGTLKAEYFVAVDGLSLPLVGLSVFVMLVATISSWTTTRSPKGYFSLLLILNASIIGTFTALDLLLFYLFFEFMLLPMYFLIGLWGGPRREYASVKFFLYTLFGSVLILLVIIGLYLSSSINEGGQVTHTFDVIQLANPAALTPGTILHTDSSWMAGPYHPRLIAFILLLIGFGIKLPLVPFHTWLPDAHVEASTPISVILAAILLKVGGYGLLRMAYPIFPDAAVTASGLVSVIAVITIIYGALNALASKDLKRLIAYSSVSHMGFVVLGISSLSIEGISGAIFQMVSHGLIAAMLFVIAGVVYDRTGDRGIGNYSGLYVKMPVYTSFVLIAFFAALGLPGLSGFIGEIMVLLGAFRSDYVMGWTAMLATTGLILAAGYSVWTIQRMFLGPYSVAVPGNMHDLTRREVIMLLPIAVLIVALGIFPQILIQYINPFASALADALLGSH